MGFKPSNSWRQVTHITAELYLLSQTWLDKIHTEESFLTRKLTATWVLKTNFLPF